MLSPLTRSLSISPSSRSILSSRCEQREAAFPSKVGRSAEDRMRLHRENSFPVSFVVLDVRQHMLYENNPLPIVNVCDETILIAADIEDRFISNKIRRSKRPSQFCRILPIGRLDGCSPSPQCPASSCMARSKLLDLAFAHDSQLFPGSHEGNLVSRALVAAAGRRYGGMARLSTLLP